MTAALLLPSACPACRAPLVRVDDNRFDCRADATRFEREDGIWRMLTVEAAAATEGFLAGYRTVRQAEAWGQDNGAYFQALPFRDTSGHHAEIWRIRAQSFRTVLRRVVQPLRTTNRSALRILDLGAGNGWLANRLANQGNQVAALDLDDDSRDGLGTHRHYGNPLPFLPVQASFDHLPYAEGSVDLVIFNGALHYSTDYRTTLREAQRVLTTSGRIVILDSPFYRKRASGRAMVQERDAAFRAQHGGVCGSVTNEAFLTQDRLDTIGREIGMAWHVWRPWYGWRWTLRPLAERLRGHREPARFYVVSGSNTTTFASTQGKEIIQDVSTHC